MNNEIDIVNQWVQADGPTDVSAIFSDLGVSYEEKQILSGESGWIEKQGDFYHVVINSSESPQRRRFTAAHELAHYLLHRNLLATMGRLDRHTDRLFDSAAQNREAPFQEYHEVEANQMAAQILMPAGKVRRLFDQNATINELADTFGVSQAAMKIRLQSLNLVAR